MSEEVWYRYVDWVSVSLDGHTHTVHITCHEYRVVKHTPKGVWLYTGDLNAHMGKRWCRRDAYKQFACPTKEEALDSFIARKERQIRILKRQTRDAEDALQLARSRGSMTVISRQTHGGLLL